MALLQTIRTKAAGLLIGTLGLALLAFILSDFFSSGNAFFNKFKDNAFTVDGEVVSTGAYAQRIDEWENFEKVMSGQSSLDETASAQLRESVYQQMVKEIMLDKQAEELGLAVTSEELSDMVYGSNVFPLLTRLPLFVNQQTGQFDKAVLIQFIADVNQDPTALNENDKAEHAAKSQIWSFIENLMKYQRLEEKYASLLAGSVLVNNTEAKAAFDDSNKVADIAYVVQKYSTVADSTVSVDAKEIQALYDLRKKNFKLDTDLRKISYFIKDVVPSEADYAVVEKEMKDVHEKLVSSTNPAAVINEYSVNQYVDAFFSLSSLPLDAKTFVQSASIGEVYGPVRNDQSYLMYKLIDRTVAADSIKLQIIPLPQGLSHDIATAIVDSLHNVIKGGKDFSAVANEIQPGSNGGEIGWVNELMLSNTGIAKECFAAAKGQVLKLSLGGQTQLIRIADKTNPVPKVKLGVVLMPVVISDKTQNDIDNELNKFVSESGNIEAFDKAAENNGYSLISDQIISPAEPLLAQASGSRQVIHWAFNEKVGSVKKFDMSDKRIVAVVKNEINSDYMPLSEVSEALKSELIRDKKAEKMISDLKAKNLTSLNAYSEAVDSKVDTVKFVTYQTPNISGLNYEPIMNVYSKVGKENALDGPVKGEQGVYALTVVNSTEAGKEYNADQEKQILRQGAFYQLMTQSMMALKEKMNVKDNRVKFY